MKLPTPIKTDNPIPWCLSHLLRWPALCGVCFCLNKSTSYLSLCLSLNSFCNETSRTWASLSPETRCVISVGRLWVLAGFESQLRGFKSQSGFWLGSSPGTGCQVPIWGARFQYYHNPSRISKWSDYSNSGQREAGRSQNYERNGRRLRKEVVLGAGTWKGITWFTS